jgi:hypothetical protein
LHARGEYFSQTEHFISSGLPSKVFAATATIQYDLWKNVLSRVEFRWDHSADGNPAYAGTPFSPGFLTGPTLKNAYALIANIIYKF